MSNENNIEQKTLSSFAMLSTQIEDSHIAHRDEILSFTPTIANESFIPTFAMDSIDIDEKK